LDAHVQRYERIPQPLHDRLGYAQRAVLLPAHDILRVLDASPRAAVQSGHLVAIQFLGIEQVHGPPGRFERLPLAVNAVLIVDAARLILVETGYPCVVGDVQALPGDVPHVLFRDPVQDLLGIPSCIENEQ